jgi:hypothetical protein
LLKEQSWLGDRHALSSAEDQASSPSTIATVRMAAHTSVKDTNACVIGGYVTTPVSASP